MRSALDVAEGDFFALLGPNGAGKSTAIGIICSLVNKTAGSVSVFGHDIHREPAAAKRCIGLVPQEFNFNVFEPVVEILVNQAGYYGIHRDEAHARAEVILRQLGLWEKRRVIPRNLSGGMKRRLMIARSLVHQPRLLILDEPTAGVDIEIRHTMWEFLRKLNADGTTSYDNQANQLEVENLKGKLLLAHGTMDNNVPPNNTLAVVDALIAANKDFDLLMLPNRRHGFAMEDYMIRRRWDYFVKNLLGAEPPTEYEMGGRRPIS